MNWLINHWLNAYQTLKKPPLQTNFINEDSVKQKTDLLLTDPFNLKGTHGVNDESLLNLAGGIPTSDFVNIFCRGYSVNENVYKIEMDYDFGPDPQTGKNVLGRVSRTLDFKKRQVYNDKVQLQKKGVGIGTNLFLNQVNECRHCNFTHLKMHAAGGWDHSSGIS